MRQAPRVEPGRVFVADGIDDQRVAFPLADRVAVPRERGIRILRHVQRDLPPVLVVFPELIDVVVGLNQLEAHRVQRDARVAVRIRVTSATDRWYRRSPGSRQLRAVRP